MIEKLKVYSYAYQEITRKLTVLIANHMDKYNEENPTILPKN